MTEPVERFPMVANFKGLVQLLARNLYSSGDAFVRELVQNGHDAIRLRQHREPRHAGRIEIETRPALRELVFRDNGLGMTRREIRLFLSVIGDSGTGEAATRLAELGAEAAHALIGHFGIGMLSAFLVAKSIEVRTRKVGSRRGFLWENDGSAECLLRTAPVEHVGTEITLRVAPEYEQILDEAALRAALMRYCDFIPDPIFLNGAGPVNTMQAPWHRASWARTEGREAELEGFLRSRYPGIPLAVIPVHLEHPVQARGVLFITDQALPGYGPGGTLDVYVRRMFVRADDPDLLPPWAKFVRGVIDSPDLQPNASRESVQRDEAAFRALRGELGRLVLERLSRLASEEPERMARVCRWHQLQLKGLALYDDTFFDLVSELLSFDSNRGPTCLRDVLAKAATPVAEAPVPLRYVATEGAAAQYYRVAAAREWLVLDAGKPIDDALLRKFAQRNPGRVELIALDASEQSELFEPLPEAEASLYRALELALEQALRRRRLGAFVVSTRRFAPPTLPALVLATPESEAHQQLEALSDAPWVTPSLADLTRQVLRDRIRPLRLILNAGNPVVEELRRAQSGGLALESAYVALALSALLHARKLLTERNVPILHEQLVELVGEFAKRG